MINNTKDMEINNQNIIQKLRAMAMARPGKRVGSIGFGFDPFGFGSNGFVSKNGSS